MNLRSTSVADPPGFNALPAERTPRATAAPVLAVCGPSGSGKTTLLESVVPRLRRRGLRLSVLKHAGHGFELDRPGKDSDRLYRSGADVVVCGPGQTACRSHVGDEAGLEHALRAADGECDLILVEGHKGTPLPKVWLGGAEWPRPPGGVEGVLAVLTGGEARPRRFERFVADWLSRQWSARPVNAGILVGGRSSRMGVPKHRLLWGGRSFLDRIAAAVAPHVDRVVLLGAAPPAPPALPYLPDAPGMIGPAAGMLSAMRWVPDAAWLFAACDMPWIDEAAVRWLLGRRAPGTWAVLPRSGPGGVEPLFALYEPQARAALEDAAARAGGGPRCLARHPSAATPRPPAAIRRAWTNVNTPREYASLGRESRRRA